LDAVFEINQNLDIPIYQQLVDRIRAAVKQGILTTGTQLPTVQELSDRLGVARGTVKRAYDELEHEGVLEKVRGRGSFIRAPRAESGSRKDRAMAAIDQLLDRLEDMGFSSGEVNIFLDLKLRQRMERMSLLKVAVLECNSETLSQMADQLREMSGIEVCSYLVDSVLDYPYAMADSMDLIVTTTVHASALASLLPDPGKLVRIALRPDPRCLSRIIKLHKGASVGILSHSERFGQVLRETCETYNQGISLSEPGVFSQALDMAQWLIGKDVVLVPRGYEHFCSADAVRALQHFAERKKLISCSYEMDEGSFLYLEERIRRAREEKPIYFSCIRPLFRIVQSNRITIAGKQGGLCFPANIIENRAARLIRHTK